MVADTRSMRLRNIAAMAHAPAAATAIMPSWIGNQMEVNWVRSVMRSPLFKAARAASRSSQSMSGSARGGLEINDSRRTNTRCDAPLWFLRQAEADQNDGKTQKLPDGRHDAERDIA